MSFMLVTEYFKQTCLIFILFFLFACNNDSDEKEELDAVLQSGFEKIYYAKFALDFPHTKAALDRCKAENDIPCLKVYELFKEGKNAVLSLSADKALPAALDVIANACVSNDEVMKNNVCYGGLMSLYFYHSLEQDNLILSKMKVYPKEIKNIIFNHDFLWFYNRPNLAVWQEFVASVDVDWEHEHQQQWLIDSFNKKIDHVQGEPWVFR